MQDYSNATAACTERTVIDELYQKYDLDLQRISLEIYRLQELAFHEDQSSNLLSQFLELKGFTVEQGIAGDKTTFVATFSQGKGPVVSFNAVISKRVLYELPLKVCKIAKLPLAQIEIKIIPLHQKKFIKRLSSKAKNALPIHLPEGLGKS